MKFLYFVELEQISFENFLIPVQLVLHLQLDHQYIIEQLVLHHINLYYLKQNELLNDQNPHEVHFYQHLMDQN
jgi:hypothetical protein